MISDEASFNPRSPRGERRRCTLKEPRGRCFNPRSPRGERLFALATSVKPPSFNPRSPRGERPKTANLLAMRSSVSIHAPREGSDSAITGAAGRPRQVSIHAPREGSDSAITGAAGRPRQVSIHAPREGSDSAITGAAGRPRQVSIHAPREGSDWVTHEIYYHNTVFQSTLPARGATTCPSASYSPPGGFNPRSPRGERHCRKRQ